MIIQIGSMGFDGGGIAQGQHNIVSVPVMIIFSQSEHFQQVCASCRDSMLRIQISPNIRYEMSKLA